MKGSLTVSYEDMKTAGGRNLVGTNICIKLQFF